MITMFIMMIMYAYDAYYDKCYDFDYCDYCH